MFEDISYMIAIFSVALIALVLVYSIIIIPNRNSQLQRFLEQEDYTSAEILILDVLKKEPSHIKMLGILGDIYWKTSRQEQAVEVFETLIAIPKLSPDQVKTPLFRSATWYAQKDLILEASEILEKLLVLDPENTQYLSLLGDIYYKKNDFDKAVSVYKNVIALNAKDVSSWRALAYIYFSLNMYTDAYQAFLNLIELDTTDPDCVFKLAEICEIIGDSKQAFKYFEKIEKFNDPHYSFRAVRKMASIYKAQNQQNNYIKYLEKARFIIEENPSFSLKKEDVLDTCYQLAEFYLSDGRIHLALKEWEKILQISKNYLDTAQKFELYYSRRTLDFFKDILTNKGSDLIEVLSNFITSIGYGIDSIQSFGEEAVDFFVSESSNRWKELRRRKTILSFWCSTEVFPTDIATRLGVAFESRGIAQIYIVSAGPVLSETRVRLRKKNITVFDQNNMQEFMDARKEILTNH